MLNLFNLIPVLTSPRLILRPLTLEDAPQILELRSDDTVNTLLQRTGSRNIDDARVFINYIKQLVEDGQSVYWGMVLKETGTLVGIVCFWNLNHERNSAEIGYELMAQWQGKGLMTEAIQKAVQFGFRELAAETITACVEPDNAKSISLLVKAGFQINREKTHESELDPTLLNFYLSKEPPTESKSI